MRTNFDKQLGILNVELITMGALCEESIGLAAKSLLSGDRTLLPGVIDTDARIDQKERDIETLCMKLLLQQQPVARDLRTISSALKMISDMERIGDQAADIAEILGFVGRIQLDSVDHIGDMARATIKMVTDSIDSFVCRNLDLTHSVISYDDIVDDLFVAVKKELMDVISSDPQRGGECLDLLMIAKYFERIGDHAVNIAEWVEYSLTGHHIDETT